MASELRSSLTGVLEAPSSVIDIETLVEQPMEVDERLVANFEALELGEDAEDRFNDLGHRLPRDRSNQVSTNEELITAVNNYDYNAPMPGVCAYYACAMGTCGCYYFSKRRIVPAGYFGHYVSAGRHMLTPPGIHVLTSVSASWWPDEVLDDETELIRSFGIKTVLVVPENHIAGAFRVGGDKGSGDGDFVLFGQGRHVLDTSAYREVVVAKLDSDKVRLGPLTVLYIKEGHIGGAYERNAGVFRILPPGPPYLLHDKLFEGVDMKKRTLAPFKVGPIHFVTVKEGEIAGAYHKASGLYQLLPPGQTYMLHEKDYERLELVPRTNLFKLGPWTFITVQKGHVAGSYMKKGGEFVLLPPGNTYQLNEDLFEEPVIVKRDQHVVRCGPLTFVTLQEGVLTGAYRTSDGRFEELSSSEDSNEFVLHMRDYHGLTVVEKYSSKVQDFGPNKIVTIPEGECGVFEKEGSIQIKEPGFYKVSAEFKIRPNIPLQVNTERFDDLQFRSKDSVRMSVSAVAVWKVQEALMVAKWPGTWDELRDCLRAKVAACLGMLLRTYNRAELLPTRQDVVMGKMQEGEVDEDDALEEAIKTAAERSKSILQDTEDKSLEVLNEASTTGGWGLRLVSVKIDNLELRDEQIVSDLQSIAQAQLATKRKQVEGQQQIAAANVEREAAIQKAEAEAEVLQTQAESDARVQTASATAKSEMELSAARAKNEIDLMQATNAARADAEAKKIEFEMQRQMAENQVTIEEMKLKAKQRQAESEAAAIIAMAQANYEKGCKEQEVAGKMPVQELELKRMELIVRGLNYYGNAAWRYPDEMQGFMDQLRPFLRLGPMSGADLHSAIKSTRDNWEDA